jgi:F0F1-type ATP synthase membrane subunit c/vacuolar-type H+-ATPase subunit K
MNTLYIIFSTVPAILSSVGTSIGQGIIGKNAMDSLNRQPSASNSISKLSIIGMAIVETASIMGLVVSIMLLNDVNNITHSNFSDLAVAGIMIALGISGLCAGIAASIPTATMCHSITHQPFMYTKFLNLMLIVQTLIMTPNMFGMLISLMIKNKLPHIQSFNEAVQLFSSGLSIGSGSIGSSIGLSIFAAAACTAVGLNKKAFNKIITFTFICEAIIETPAIFALLIALMILNAEITPDAPIQAWKFISAAICIGFSTIAPSINAGKTGAAACKQIGFHLEQYLSLSRMALLALALIDSFAIYGLLVAFALLLF